MFFPTKLTDSGSSPSLSGTTVGYTQSFVELNAAQNVLLFGQQQQQQQSLEQQQHQQNQQLHLQQLQQLHQHQQLQYEMAQISLGSPRTPTTPVHSITIPEHGSQIISPIRLFPSSPAIVSSPSVSTAASSPMAPALSTICANGTSAPIHHPALSQFQSSYHSAPRQQQQQQQQQQSPMNQASIHNPISSPYFSQTDSPFVTDVAVFGTSDPHDIDLFPLNPVTSSMPNHVQSIMHSPFNSQEFTPGHLNVPAAGSTTVTSAHSSPILPLDCVKHERLSPTIQPLVLCNCPDKYPCGQLNHMAPASTSLAKSLYSVIGEEDEYNGCYSSSSSEHVGSDDGIDAEFFSQLPSLSSPSSVIGTKPSSSSSSSSTCRSGTQRPKSMLVTSSSFSFSGQPYESPFHKDSPMVAQPRPRRSSSGTFAYYSPATATSLPTYTFGAGHQSPQSSHQQYHHHHQQHQHQGQQQVPRPSIIHHPQQQYVQHLLDPEMVPKITDIHVCPVCQRRFSRPFNLRSHIMTHTTSRPFPCDECHWRFSRQHDLLRHKRAKHPGSVPPLPPKAPKVKSETQESN
ncbi:hypothetical protein BGX24_008414 [Mortierella sp. AD032]|nr:hypothetical protein BGX24_008414 [Mortierella sp. AD032]